MKSSPTKRVYRQASRAAAAEDTARRILTAFQQLARTQWYEHITLEAIARDAGVTVQTVIRRFGGKDGLLAALFERVAADVTASRAKRAPDDPTALVATVVDDYEVMGEMVLHMLVQESRWPPVHELCERGRVEHRKWISAAFAEALQSLPAGERRARIDALVVATDVYTWKLLRRDMARSVSMTKQLMLLLVRGVLGAEVS